MIGQTLGSYRILESIGRGGMGVVYLAEHTVLRRKAAVKVLLPEASRDADLVDRFFNEARAAAQIQHPGLVEVFDYGTDEVGNSFIVMELLAGESLGARIDREYKLAITTAMAITRQVASALYAAHQQGIIHRDLKPENIYLIDDPDAPAGVRAKVLDFGIAKLSRDDEPRSVKTKTGAVFGTPRYMSPEQCKNATNVDGRSDIYALGCIVHEMVLGVAPFDYDNWGELIAAHIHETPRRPRDRDPGVPEAVDMIIQRALAKSLDDRYQTMQELANDAEAVWRGTVGEGRASLFTPMPMPAARPSTDRKAVSALPTGSAPTLPVAAQVTSPPSERARWPWFAVGAVLLAAAGVAIVLFMQRTDERSTPRPADPPIATVTPDAAVRVEHVAPIKDTVELTIDSKPAGADVFREADGVKVGKTPMTRSFERIDGEAVFIVKLAGYTPERIALSTSQDGKKLATLEREHRQRPTPPRPRPTPKGSAGPTVLDPYGEK